MKKNTRYSPVSGCICLIGLHIQLISKDLTSDKRFDPLSITKYDLIRNVNILQGIPLIQGNALQNIKIANQIVFVLSPGLLFCLMYQKGYQR